MKQNNVEHKWQEKHGKYEELVHILNNSIYIKFPE